jgi:hypothetical protein
MTHADGTAELDILSLPRLALLRQVHVTAS